MTAMHRFLWERPLDVQPQLAANGDNNEEKIPIKFVKKMLNTQLEDDGFTISHSRGGKGFAIVDKNLNDGCGNSEFYEWKVNCLECFVFFKLLSLFIISVAEVKFPRSLKVNPNLFDY